MSLLWISDGLARVHFGRLFYPLVPNGLQALAVKSCMPLPGSVCKSQHPMLANANANLVVDQS
jgi:hypothetical protein